MGIAGMVGSQVLGMYQSRKALQRQAQANADTAKNLILSMNFAFQASEQARQDAFEATIADLENMRLQGNRLEQQVNASVNEGLMGGGRTADLLLRSAQADTNRALNASKTNYQKRSNEIDLNKEVTLLNTRQQIDALKQIETPSFLDTTLQLFNIYLGARNFKGNIDAMRNTAGINKDYKSSYNSGINYGKFGLMDAIADQYKFNTSTPITFNLHPPNPYERFKPYSQPKDYTAMIGGV